MQQAISPRRPLGVTIIAILVGIQALLLLFLAIVSLFLVVLPGWTASTGGGPTGARITALVVGLLFLLFGAVSFFLAYGLWTLKRWAFMWVVIVEGASVIFGLVGLFSSDGNRSIWSFILPIIILLYFLLDRNVRAAFRI
jgi:hypothetical protein